MHLSLIFNHALFKIIETSFIAKDNFAMKLLNIVHLSHLPVEFSSFTAIFVSAVIVDPYPVI